MYYSSNQATGHISIKRNNHVIQILKRFFFQFSVLFPLLILIHTLLPAYHKFLLLEIIIWALFAISFDLLFGYCGLLSFGQCLFFGIGAYGCGLSIIHLNLPILPAFLFGAMCAGILAFLTGLLIIRLESHYFVIMTVLLALIFLYLGNNLSSFTGGDDGIPIDVPNEIIPNISTSNQSFNFITYFSLAAVVIIFILTYLFLKSPYGLIFKGIRDNSRRATFLGYSPNKYKFLAWVIAGFIAGFAGTLYVLVFKYVSTFHLHWTLSGEGIVWTILGGKGTLYGPLLGTAILIFFKDTVSSYIFFYPLIVGIFLIACIHILPNGLLSLIKVKSLIQKLFFTVKPNSITNEEKPKIDKILQGNQNIDYPHLLKIENLCKSFGGIKAVDQVSISLGKKDAFVLLFPKENIPQPEKHQIFFKKSSGDIPDFSIVGPNAAGKSTFFNLLTGLITPDDGKITFKGTTLYQKKKGKKDKTTRAHKIVKMGITRTFQHLSIFPKISVYENLWLAAQSTVKIKNPFYPAECYQDIRKQVNKILGLLGLEPEAIQIAGTLSFGRQKLLEIGMAILTSPLLLLLDEPLAGVSPKETDRIISLILMLSKEMGVLIIEHNIEAVKRLSLRTIVFGNGKIICEGTPEEILKDKYVQENFLGSITS